VHREIEEKLSSQKTVRESVAQVTKSYELLASASTAIYFALHVGCPHIPVSPQKSLTHTQLHTKHIYIYIYIYIYTLSERRYVLTHTMSR
jgi:hypothetical protein